jgi:sulfonate transport system substrate-binding protein
MSTSSTVTRSGVVTAILALLTAVLAACGSGGSAGSGDPKTIRVELFCSGLAPIAAELALNSGIAAQKGITIKPMCVSSGSTATQALIGGSADVFMGDIGHVVLAQKQGVPMRAYGVVNDRFSYVMVARKDAHLASVKDLAGKKVAVTAPGTLSDTELQKAALDAGLNPKKDLTVVSGGAGATMQAELNGGQVVAGMTSQPDTLQLMQTGNYQILWQQPDYQYVDIIPMAKQDWVAQHQDLMRNFLASMSEASAQAKADPALATTWMKKQGYKISDADLQTIVTEAMQSVPDGLRVPDQVVATSNDLLKRTGLLSGDIPATSDLLDYSLLPAK